MNDRKQKTAELNVGIMCIEICFNHLKITKKKKLIWLSAIIIALHNKSNILESSEGIIDLKILTTVTFNKELLYQHIS